MSKLTTSDLIKAVGDEKVKIQNLDVAAIRLDYSSKSGTKITFGTDQLLLPTGTEMLGLVVWLPRDAVKQVLKSQPTESEARAIF